MFECQVTGRCGFHKNGESWGGHCGTHIQISHRESCYGSSGKVWVVCYMTISSCHCMLIVEVQELSSSLAALVYGCLFFLYVVSGTWFMPSQL